MITRRRAPGLFVVGLVAALILAGAVSFYASSQPDGLNKVAIDEGFAATEKPHALAESPLAGYAAEDVDDERLSTAVAGVVGVLVTLAIGGGVFVLLRRTGRMSAAPSGA